MAKKIMKTMDGNTAAAHVSYAFTDVASIYPITPSSTMAEVVDEWAAYGRKNIFGQTVKVAEMQSEAGAAGAVHGSLAAGALSTTYTASQGLLLMIPNMYKIAGELTSFVMHVSARAVASHGLSIFGDQTDVMACRQTGFAMLCSNSVQEAHDLALVAHSATLDSRVPFLHFFDGFRTSHEVNTYDMIPDEVVREMIDYDKVLDIRARSLDPDRPFIRGTAQNPDVFFQSWEARNSFYDKCADIIEEKMEKLGKLTGRTYKPYQYEGAPDAEKIIVIMGSGAETVEETVKALNAKGEKLGVLKVRMFRPFSVKKFAAAIPQTAKVITVLDRTKELGAMGEPLYQEVSASISEARASGFLPRSFDPVILGGRYGLGSKEFTPAMVKGVFDNASAQSPKNHFSVGINDDVTHNSISYDESFKLDENGVMSAVFFGLGADGTVGANKNTIKIIGNGTPNYAQAYFVYDSKKSGGLTVSHLRFGPNPIRAPYLINNAQFVACHQFSFMQKYDVLSCAAEGAVFLLNSIYDANNVWNHLNSDVQRTIIEKKLKFYVIDAYEVAKKTGMGGRINTVMQTCYFAVSGVLPKDEAIEKIKAAIEKTYSKKGRQVVEKNFAAVDASVENCHKVEVPSEVTAESGFPATVSDKAPDFVKRVTAVMMREQGDKLPVSAFPVDGTWPSATTQWEKRNIAIEIPSWNPELCIQCTKCATICPHAAIRAKFYKNDELKDAPEGFKHTAFRSKDNPDCSFTIQVAPEDCTGCGLCATVCPGKSRTQEGVKALMMVAQEPVREVEEKNFEFFLKSSQFGIVLRNTLLYNIVFIVLNIVIPVTLAILINQLYSKRKSKTYQTMMFMPHFMSWVVVSYFVFAFLSYDKGLLNSVLEAFGKDPINWYTEAKYWPFILVFMQVWKTVGYNMVVYLASISGIDTSLYEAGALDGASKFQQAIHITLPALKPVIIMMFILSVGRIFSTDFGLFYQIPRGVTNSLYEATMTFDVYIYNMLLTPNVPIGRTAAAGFFQSVIGCITILVANAIVRKVDRQSAII